MTDQPSERPPPGHPIGREALKLFVGTLASRLLGFVRLRVMAGCFGGGTDVDVFNVAYAIPNLFRGVLGEHAIEGAFLPTFQSLASQGKIREAWRMASVVLNWLTLALIVASSLCFAFAPGLCRLQALGFEPAQVADAARLARWMCPFMVLIGLAAFFGSLLLAHRQNWAYGMAPTLFNVGSIATMLLFHKRLGPLSMSLGVVVGGVLELAGAYLPLPWGRHTGRVKGRCKPATGLSDTNAAEALRNAAPIFLAALITRCESNVDCAVASFLAKGSIAALKYAMPLLLFPFALFALSIGRAALVPLTEHAAANNADGFQHSIGTALRLGLLVLVPLSAGTAILAYPLTELLRTGKFQQAETDMAATALFWYAPALLGMGMTSILTRALYALKNTWAPLWAAAVALSLNALLSIALALTPLRHGGIALATSIAMALEALLLFLWLRRELRRRGMAVRFNWLGPPVLKICLATFLMSVVVAGYAPLGRACFPGTSLPACTARIILPAAPGAVLYGLLMFLLDRQDVRRILRRTPPSQ